MIREIYKPLRLTNHVNFYVLAEVSPRVEAIPYFSYSFLNISLESGLSSSLHYKGRNAFGSVASNYICGKSIKIQKP